MTTDQQLWDDLRGGQPLALEKVYTKHFSYLYDYGKRLSTNASTVEDAIQELFMEIWQNRERLSTTTAIRPYLIVSLRRKLFRKIKQSRDHTALESAEDHFPAELAVEELIISGEHASEQSERLQAAFAELSARQKEILYLKYYSNLDYGEICEIMELNNQSARNLTSRALKNLARHFGLWLILYLSVFIEYKS